ncbi:MAG: DUF2157 domain-containing protein [Endomicrobium sp.]|jgi:uncharacterized membrane protein|nr:DUF2157 domain-containing protein [Endomicrobium sp.]
MKEFIDKWLEEGLINREQAKQMLADIKKGSSERSSKKIILTFSLIGAVLAGAGFLLFISANWQVIPAMIKVFLMSAITFGCAFSGYYLEFENKKYPRTGASLLFLSTVMFGALIFLTAQIYHINSSGMHVLILIWILGIIPYAYILHSHSVAVLSCVLFSIWISAFMLKNYMHDEYLRSLPLVYCIAALFVYSFGRFNKFFSSTANLSSVFKKFGILAAYFCTFFMTFNYFAVTNVELQNYMVFPWFTDIMLIFSIAMFIVSFFFNPSKSKANNAESILITSLICMCVILYGNIFIRYEWVRIITNLFFISIILVLIYVGYKKAETFYVNTAIFWIIVFITVKYFDFFWKLLPRSLFFLAGGILLIGAALFLEHKRRTINMGFKKPLATWTPNES